MSYALPPFPTFPPPFFGFPRTLPSDPTASLNAQSLAPWRFFGRGIQQMPMGDLFGFDSFQYKSVPSRSLTAKAPENGWLEDDPASYWVSVTFQGLSVKLREGHVFLFFQLHL